jgi:hypothetical protein
MNSTWSFYRLSGGVFTGDTFTGPSEEDAQRHADSLGCGYLLGRYDHLSQRVDLNTGDVLDWQPPAPADDAMQTWDWDADVKRWLPRKTFAARRAERVAAVQAEIESAELQQARPMREILDAQLASQSVPAETIERWQAIKARIGELQAARRALVTAQDDAALDAAAATANLG